MLTRLSGCTSKAFSGGLAINYVHLERGISINISDSGIVRPGSEIFHFHNWLSGMYCYGTQSERKYVFMQWSPTMLYMKA